MDFFGIGSALEASANIYFHCARQSGRTTALLDTLEDGDTVFCLSVQHAKWLEQRFKERNLNVECVKVDVNDPYRIMESIQMRSRRRPYGRAVFDHDWVEQYYLNVIKKAGEDIQYLQRECSHKPENENPLQEKEAIRWGQFSNR